VFQDDEEWEENLDSTIYVSKEDKEVWIPTFKQRAIAGFVIAIFYMLITLLFWEVSIKAALVGASLFFVLTILLGERFVKFLAFIVEHFGIN
jgi:hypothetical protein